MQRLLRITSRVSPSAARWSSMRSLPRHRALYSTEPIVVKVPGMGDSITEGELSSWAVGVGEQVAADELVCEIETDKITVEINAEKSGTVTQHFAEEGDTVLVGNDLYALEPGAVEAKAAAEATPEPASAPPKAPPAEPATPAAPTQTIEPPKSAPAAAAPVAAAGARTERRVKMKKMRRRIADRLKDSQNTYAMLTTFNEIDMSALIEMRNEYKEDFLKTHDVKLGFMSAFAKAASNCLVNQPVVNAVIDGPEMVYRDYVDISVAVASPTGLVVPVLRNVENMSLADIERSIGEYAGKARDGTLSMEEMAGGTFTISNGGVFGSLMGTPIINPPQSAILGMHATNPRPVAIDGKVEIRPMMYIALTYDHRAIDGREAATFLVQLKRQIEDPRRMILGL